MTAQPDLSQTAPARPDSGLSCHDPMHRESVRLGPLRNGNPRGNPRLAPRCGARTRSGAPCQGPAVRGRGRCRMHGGRSTGPRTEAGLARMRAAKTTHGGYGEAAVLTALHVRMMVGRTRVVVEAARLRRWLPEAMRRRLEAGARELPPVPDPAWWPRDATTLCTVRNGRRVARGRALAATMAAREAALLAPWRTAIAAAKLAWKEERESRHEPMRRESGGMGRASGVATFARGEMDGTGDRRGVRQDRLHGVNVPLPLPPSREGRRNSAPASRHEPMRREQGPTWSAGWKGALCAGTYLGSAAAYVAARGGWLQAFGVTGAAALPAVGVEVGRLGWTLPETGLVW